jgi:HK97 family phage major capsid protein
MAPRTAGQFAKLKSTTNDPLGLPPVLAGIPMEQTTAVSIAEGTAQSSLYLGDWTKMLIGMRTSLRVQVLRERYADNLQYGFLGYMRADVNVSHAGAFGRLIAIPAVGVLVARDEEPEAPGRGRKG